MSSVLIVILLLIGLLVLASIVLGRMTHEVKSARDTEYVELEGSWIRYHVAGGGPPVVLVHGWLSSSRVWEQVADRLAQRFTVYTLDLSGFGDSDKPISGYGIRYGSRLLYAFCAHFGITRTAVIGHDIGGAMAAKLAADHPDLVGRLVLVGTPANENQIDLPTLLWLATLPVVGPVFYTLGRFLRPLRKLWMRPFVFDPEDLTEEVVDDAGKSTPAALSKTLSVTRREIARGRLVRQAGIIKVPVLVVVGEEDQIVDPQATENWSRALPAEIVFLNECGHLPMLERTSQFNAQILTFLTGEPHHLQAVAKPPEEIGLKDEEATELPEESLPFTHDVPGDAGPDVPPTVTRKQDGRYPPRDREGAENHSDPSAERYSGRSTNHPNESEDAEKLPRRHTENGGDTDVPEMPEGLFEWPDLKKSEPWDRPHDTDQETQEDRGEDAPPEDQEENGPR